MAKVEPGNCSVSGDWMLSLLGNKTLLQSAPYSPSEEFFLVVIWMVVAVGFLVNIIGIFMVIQNRTQWDNYKWFLVFLGLADLLYLFSALVFFAVPYWRSPVSFDYPFSQCYTLLGSILFSQVFESGMILAVAIEAYLRICNKKSPFDTTHVILITAAVAATFVPLAIPGLFADSKPICVRWPALGDYNEFPEIITICPLDTLTTTRLFIFHDIPAFWAVLTILIYCYYSVINHIKSDEKCLKKAEIISNMRARLIVFFLCQVVARVYNFANMIDPLFDRFSLTYEVFNFILRLLLILQSTINPFVYFFANDNYGDLVKKLD